MSRWSKLSSKSTRSMRTLGGNLINPDDYYNFKKMISLLLQIAIGISFLFSCAVLHPTHAFINTNQLNKDYVEKIKLMSKEQMAVFVFVQVKVNNKVYPVVIEDYILFWDYFRNTDWESSFNDTLGNILTRKNRIFKADSIPVYTSENYVVDAREFANYKKSGLDKFEVYDRHFSSSSGWLPMNQLNKPHLLAAVAYLIDQNVIVERGDISGDIYVHKP